MKAGSLGAKLIALRKLKGKARVCAEDVFVQEAETLLSRILYRRAKQSRTSDYLDMMQDARVGLLIAMVEWDPSQCASFAHFARWKIWGAVRTGIRAGRLIRGVSADRFAEHTD